MDEDIYGLSAGEALNRIKSAQGAGEDIYSMSASDALKRLKKQPWEEYGVPKNPMEESNFKRMLRGANIGLTEGGLALKQALPFMDLSPEDQQKLAAGKSYMEAESGMAPEIGKGLVGLGEYAGGPLAVGRAGLRGMAGFAGRTAGAGLTGGVLTPGGAEERISGAGIGAAGSVLGEAAPYAVGTVKRAVEPLYAAGHKNILSRTLQRAAGDRSADVARELEMSASQTPGVQYTASEAAPSSGGLAAIQRWAEQATPEDYAFRRKTNVEARRAALEGIAGTEADKLTAIATRETEAGPLYEAAKAKLVPVDKELQSLLKRPSMALALNQAKDIAAEQGTPIPKDLIDAITSGEVPADISGEALHWIKVGLDNLRSMPKESIGKEQQRAIKGTVDAFEKWRGENIPVYAQAQEKFAELSKPISRMEVGKSLYEKLSPALSDYGSLTRETAESYARALRNADVTAQQATGFRGARFADIMQPSDLETYASVAKDLTRQAESSTAGRGIGSNTFQNLAMQNLSERAGFPGTMIGKVMRMPLIDYAYTRAEQEMQKELADTLLNPKRTAALLRRGSGPLSRMFSAERVQPFSSAVGAEAGSYYNR